MHTLAGLLVWGDVGRCAWGACVVCAYLHAYIHLCMHTETHTYTYAYAHAYIHTPLDNTTAQRERERYANVLPKVITQQQFGTPMDTHIHTPMTTPMHTHTHTDAKFLFLFVLLHRCKSLGSGHQQQFGTFVVQRHVQPLSAGEVVFFWNSFSERSWSSDMYNPCHQV